VGGGGWGLGVIVVKQLSDPKKHRQGCLISSAQSFHCPCLRLVVYSLTWGFLGMCHSSKCPPNV